MLDGNSFRERQPEPTDHAALSLGDDVVGRHRDSLIEPVRKLGPGVTEVLAVHPKSNVSWPTSAIWIKPLISHVSVHCECVPIANSRPLAGNSSPHRSSICLSACSSEYCRRQLKKVASVSQSWQVPAR